MLSLTVEGDINGMTAYMASFGYKAIFISVIMVAFVNAIGIPSVLFLTVNGVIFGLIPGILISWAGEVIGIEISFHLTRTLFRGQAQRFIGGSDMFGKLDSYSCIRTIMAGRAIPYAPNVVVTALGALSHISYRDHFIANVIGKFPAVAVEVWLGHDLLLIREHWQRLLAVSAIVALVYGILWWRRKHGNS
jgi:putative membrane protein